MRNYQPLFRVSRTAFTAIGAALLTLVSTQLSAQSPQRQNPAIMSLLKAAPLSASVTEAISTPSTHLPANFHAFGIVRDGRPGETHELTLGFTSLTTITHLKSTPDFHIVEGGTCAEGNRYGPETSCTVRIAFEPKGPGNRTGKLTVEHSAASRSESIGLGGTNYAPAVSFVPSIINTIPSTYNATTKKGLIAYPYYLAIDGGDNLYVADLGNSTNNAPPEVDIIDSSGALTLFAGGGGNSPGDGDYAMDAELVSPQGMGADSYGNLFIADYESDRLRKVDIDQIISTVAGPGNGCTSLPCPATQFLLAGVTSVVVSPQENIYLSVFGISQELLLSGGELYLYGSDPEGYDDPLSLALDSNNNLLYSTFNFCQIRSVSPSTGQTAIVAGTRTCGYTGDGGQARSAELGEPREVAVDAANNLYIADQTNHVIRRIDAATGLIHTIAGIAGKTGYTGNGGPATAATFNDAYGVVVDSNGNVYVGEAPTGDIRKIGPTGNLVFSSFVGTPTAIQTITVSNTGNSTLSISKLVWTGSNVANFTLDSFTTTCPFLPSGTGSLAVGQTCTIGVIFKPTVAGAAFANMNFGDNTNLGVNTIQLNGTGLKLSPVLTWPTPAPIITTTALSPTQLDATATYNGATVAGTFVYTPAAGTKLAAGKQTLKTVFTPTNTALYNVDSTTTTITVTAPAVKPKVALVSNRNPSRTKQPITFAATLDSTDQPETKSIEPTGYVEFFDGRRRLGSTHFVDGKATLMVKSLAVGNHTILAVYWGDEHFPSSYSSTLPQKITK